MDDLFVVDSSQVVSRVIEEIQKTWVTSFLSMDISQSYFRPSKEGISSETDEGEDSRWDEISQTVEVEEAKGTTLAFLDACCFQNGIVF